MTLNEIVEKLKVENARSKEKHGPWSNLSETAQFGAIYEEIQEWLKAFMESNVDGEHGEIAELLQVANVCIRRMMFLTGERDA